MKAVTTLSYSISVLSAVVRHESGKETDVTRMSVEVVTIVILPVFLRLRGEIDPLAPNHRLLCTSPSSLTFFFLPCLAPFLVIK